MEAFLFAFFLWKTAVPTPVTRRFSFLLLVEVVTLLTSDSGIPLLFNYQLSGQTQTIIDVLHHLGDVLMLVLYPIFVAHALPLPLLKRVTGVPGRIALWSVGLLLLVWVALDHTKIFVTSFDPDMLLYLIMCIMFVLIFIASLLISNRPAPGWRGKRCGRSFWHLEFAISPGPRCTLRQRRAGSTAKAGKR